ncbi:MAG: DUF2207 domain-containing protein, partial [Thermodesulfovibrionales bacterium]
DYVVGFEIISILRDGRPESFHTANLSNGKRIYIGKEDVFLDPGEYTYTITYRTARQLGFFEDHDELYWNVTGNGWVFPMEKVTATVELPPAASGRVMEVDAYTGPQGAKGKDFRARIDESGAVRFRTIRPIGSFEGLTILVSWPKGIVHEPTQKERMGYFILDNRAVVAGAAGVLLLLCYYLFAWIRVGRDPGKGTVIPLFAPPADLSPAAIRFVRRMGSDNKAFAAALIDMAVKGAVSIAEEGKQYTVTNKKGTPTLSPEEKEISSHLFSGPASEIELRQENHRRIRTAINAFDEALKKGFEKVYFVGNMSYFVAGVVLSVLIGGMVLLVSLSAGFSEEIPFVFVLGVFGGVFSTVIIKLWKSGKKITALFMFIILGLFFIPFALVLPFAPKMRWLLLIFFFIVFLDILFYYLLKARTETGRRLMDRIEGFRIFLSVTEKDRLNFINPPEKTPELFEKYLPYALALDVEQEWAEQFAGVLAVAQYVPTWYVGRSWDVNHMGDFSGSLGSSFSSAIASSSTAPGSASGGGGGGSSGGGGGGGGGGGW